MEGGEGGEGLACLYQNCCRIGLTLQQASINPTCCPTNTLPPLIMPHLNSYPSFPRYKVLIGALFKSQQQSGGGVQQLHEGKDLVQPLQQPGGEAVQ